MNNFLKNILIALSVILITTCARKPAKFIPLSGDYIPGPTDSSKVIEEIDLCEGTIASAYGISIECGGRDLEIFTMEAKEKKNFLLALEGSLGGAVNLGYKKLDSSENELEVLIQDPDTNMSIWANIEFWSDKKFDVIRCIDVETKDMETCPNLIEYVKKNRTTGFKLKPAVTKFLQIGSKQVITGPLCGYMSGRNYQCPGQGQISWSIHESREKAERIQKLKKKATVMNEAVKLLEDEYVSCEVNKKETKCNRVKILFTGKAHPYFTLNNILGATKMSTMVIYYAIDEDNGKYLESTCSFYSDQAPVDGLALLCRDYITLK